MSITLSQLESFCWIARLGSFRAAAVRCNRTQATVSLRIQELERTLGIALFDRGGQRARVTPDGADLLSYAERILALTEEMYQKAHAREGLKGIVRLGTIDSFAVTCLNDLLSTLSHDHPELQVDVFIDHTVTIARKLDGRELDLAFLLEPDVSSQFVVEPLCEISASWVAAPDFVVPRRIIEPFDLAKTLIFSLPPPATTYTDIQRWFSTGGIEPDRINTCSSLPMIVPFVAAGLGVALLPRPVTLAQLKAGTLRQLITTPLVPSRRMCIGYHPDRLRSSVTAVVERGRKLILERLSE